jgi:DsbC/DsbD-like thiol-disulfide interchange protein
MISRIFLILISLWGESSASVRSGQAEAEWISTTGNFVAGQPVQTAVSLVLDENWHTYWTNPGEGGMKITAKWELPDQWQAGDLEHPVPKRFTTGGLAGFGYEGSILFPVTLLPPPDATGKVKLIAHLSWLACNDESCIPGQAKLELVLSAGPPIPGPRAAEIEASLTKIPRASPNSGVLQVVENPKTLTLTLESPGSWDPQQAEFFPATPQVVDPAAPILFHKTESRWLAEVPLSEYATRPVREFSLVVSRKDAGPISLKWTAK